MHSPQKPRIVTTSWDDGDQSDQKLAEVLRSTRIQGTFYVPINNRERPLDRCQLKNLASEGFEIGAHGYSHRPLSGLPPLELAQEVGPCKQILEDIIGREVRMFCYPYGRYDASVVRALQEARYWGARTIRTLATRPGFNPFEMPTTLQVFPHKPFTYFMNVATSQKLESWQTCLVQRAHLGNWLELGKGLFDAVLKNGGIWHLYGHSREVESLGLWDDLREILNYVSGREGVKYSPNCEQVPRPTAWTARSSELVQASAAGATSSAQKSISEDFTGSR